MMYLFAILLKYAILSLNLKTRNQAKHTGNDTVSVIREQKCRYLRLVEELGDPKSPSFYCK